MRWVGSAVAVAGLMAVSGAIGVAAGRRGTPRGSGRITRDPRDPDGTTRLKEEFLTTVSHELRTPLNAILGWTELLRTRPLPDADLERGLEVIHRNALRQLTLVEELLAVAEPAQGSEQWERVDLRALIHGLLEGLDAPAAAASVTVERDAHATAAATADAPVWVYGNPAGLRLALRHILENAVKFTPSGGRVRAGVRETAGDAVVEVSDTGAGLDASASDQLFEPFRQQDSSASRRHGGLGLGLTIARRLVHAHGGRIDVRSPGQGRGSTFLVMLPLCTQGS